MAHVLIWEFLVKAGNEAEFEAVYGPQGEWAKLFASSDGFLGTELLRHALSSRQYLTIDRWRDMGDYALFRAAKMAEYDALDAKCADLSERETALDAWSPV